MATTTRKRTTAKTATPAAKTETPAEAPVKVKPQEVDLHQYIPVRNGFNGMLIYVSSRTGEAFRWDSFGDEQDIELLELRNAKNTGKEFFINNWFMFDEDYDWVLDYLGVRNYYRNAVDVEGFDEIFQKTPAEIKKVVKEMSDGQKKSLMYRSKDLIASGEIDSRKVIAALEEALGIDLIEK